MSQQEPDHAATQRHLWTIGDYPAIARHMVPVAVAALDAGGVEPGDRVLDVGVGDGNAAIEAARRGATVTGVDLTPAQLDLARNRAEREGVELTLLEGDAQRLDLPDGAYDVVVSVLGAIFAPDHRAAMAEMARVCAPGGRVALTAWGGGGWMARWKASIAHLVPGPPPPGGPDPDAWGDPAEMGARFAAAGLDAIVTEHELVWSLPSVEATAELFLTASGPFMAFMSAQEAAGNGDEARAALLDALASANRATDGTCEFAAPYLVGAARR